MLFDKEGLPRDLGATDKMDSARLAGIMVIFNHPLAPDLTKYVTPTGEAVRHPSEVPANNPKNFSRDQLMCLAVGLSLQGSQHITANLYDAAEGRNWFAQNVEVDKPGTSKTFPDGPDWLSFSNRMILKMAAGYKGNLLGYFWLAGDVLFNALFTPNREPNQLLAQLVMAGPRWIKFYKLVTPSWRKAIRGYWSGWRAEPELAELMVSRLEAI